jgi:ABC-type branched-subunit amino acid transport system ATPase component
LRSLRDEGITILRIECSMDVVMNLLDHTVVRDFGSRAVEVDTESQHARMTSPIGRGRIAVRRSG